MFMVKRFVKDRGRIARKIVALRRRVDCVDKRLIDVLALRSNLVQKIGICKMALEMPLYQHVRFAKIIKLVTAMALTKGLNPIMVKKIYEVIHHNGLKTQRRDSRVIKKVSRKKRTGLGRH